MANKKITDLAVATAAAAADAFVVVQGGTTKQIAKSALAATTGEPGTIQLAGALGGTAASPTALGYADAAALASDMAAKADVAALTTHTGNTSNPHAVTKAQVGLANVDNTADSAKPVSTAQQAAIDAKVQNTLAASTTVAPSATAVNNALAAKADLVSPALTGTPTTPTAAQGTNTTQIASTAFVVAAIASLVNSSTSALDTLNELATALGNDPNFATTMTNALAGKAPLASPAFTGAPTAPTQTQADNSTKVATTEYVDTGLGTKVSALSDVAVSSSRALIASDVGKVLKCTTTGGAVALTVTAGLMTPSQFVLAQRIGANGLTFSPDTGVTINDPNAAVAGNHALIGIFCESTNVYTLIA